MYYWFIYNKETGESYGAPYLGSAAEWGNIPDGCDVLGPYSKDNAPEDVIRAFSGSEWRVDLKTKSLVIKQSEKQVVAITGPVDEEKVALAEAIIDLEERLAKLEAMLNA